MPKTGMEPIRRSQLIKATMAAIDEVGLADATVLRIARHAGVSAGIISHYFGGKDGLLEATMRQVLSDLGQAVAARRCKLANGSPRDHLGAIIDGNFDRSQISGPAAKTWLAFWASSMHKTQLQRLQQVNDQRLYSNLCCQFRRLMPHDAARDAARGLAAMIDGLWLRGTLSPEGLDTERARRIAHGYLDQLLVGYDTSTATSKETA
ncbi:transcriptional regulator BetI [Halomonas sp. LR3S48]|uniref:transcriptional regulator BetI n=1 Tax=Halomonadaceae TaxID=28256 RepID=UPI0021E39FC3|nr:transcriptional regulator BetI [Halomonas sp. LR3S48]UYG02342.1 transcriptional regulator BetI [Halomonas sp. LR3S48]